MTVSSAQVSKNSVQQAVPWLLLLVFAVYHYGYISKIQSQGYKVYETLLQSELGKFQNYSFDISGQIRTYIDSPDENTTKSMPRNFSADYLESCSSKGSTIFNNQTFTF